jgi:hypothetical protein
MVFLKIHCLRFSYSKEWVRIGIYCLGNRGMIKKVEHQKAD